MVDAVTLGHLKLILRAGGTPDRIVFNGNSKTEEELRFALDRRVAVINVDSLEEMQLIASLQPVTATVPQQVCLRIAVDNTRLMAEDPELAEVRPAGQVRHGSGRRAGRGRDRARAPRHRAGRACTTTSASRLRRRPTRRSLDVMRHERCLEQTLDVARSIREEHGHGSRSSTWAAATGSVTRPGTGPGALTEFPTADDYAMAVAGTARSCVRSGISARRG